MDQRPLMAETVRQSPTVVIAQRRRMEVPRERSHMADTVPLNHMDRERPLVHMGQEDLERTLSIRHLPVRCLFVLDKVILHIQQPQDRPRSRMVRILVARNRSVPAIMELSRSAGPVKRGHLGREAPGINLIQPTRPHLEFTVHRVPGLRPFKLNKDVCFKENQTTRLCQEPKPLQVLLAGKVKKRMEAIRMELPLREIQSLVRA
jgi:hypothetical protein